MKDTQYQEKSMYSAVVEEEQRQLDKMRQSNDPGKEDMGTSTGGGSAQLGPDGGKK